MVDLYLGIWDYQPSTAAAAIASILFLLMTGVHTYQLVKTGTWWFLPFVLGCYVESAAYISRAVGASQNGAYTLPPYAVDLVLVLIAPPLFTISMYAVLKKVIRLTEGEKHAVMSSNLIMPIYLSTVILIMFAECAASAFLIHQTYESIKTGYHILIVGLVIQIVAMATFMGTSIVFEGRMNTNPTAKVFNDKNLPWQKHTYNIYIAGAFIILRSIERMVEYAYGAYYYGYLVQNEWPVYIFDALFMLVVTICFAVVHPSQLDAMIKGEGVMVKHFWKVETFTPDRPRALSLPRLTQAHGPVKQTNRVSINPLDDFALAQDMQRVMHNRARLASLGNATPASNIAPPPYSESPITSSTTHNQHTTTDSSV